MSKLELDDQILEHPKFIRAARLAGSEAIHMWLGLRAFCGQQLTDGFIPVDMLDEVRGPKLDRKRSVAMEALITVGLLEQEDGGFRMHNYLKWSRSKSQVLADRARARERQAKSREMSRRDTGRDDAGASVRVTKASGSSSASDPPDPDSHTPGAREDRFGDSFRASDRLPDGWEPSPDNVALAQRLGLDLPGELAEFRAYCRREDRVCGAWEADFELWLRRAKKFERKRDNRRGGAPMRGAGKVDPNVDPFPKEPPNGTHG